MTISTSLKGIFPSDVIIRTAIIKGLEELRQKPYLLDFVFNGLIQDDLTSDEYGIKELEKAKDWFLRTNFPVMMSYHIDSISIPRISVSLEESTEITSTLGDINPEDTHEDIATTEIVQSPDKAIGPFTPSSYNSTTGFISLPSDFDSTSIFTGMYIVDRTVNTSYVITDVGEGGFYIQAGIIANFTNAIVTHVSNLLIAQLESLEFKETYRIDLYVSGNPTHLLYLWAIVNFALLRNKQDYLEARGFERSIMMSQGVKMFEAANAEFIFQRTIILNGFVRQYWPKSITSKIDGINVGLLISNENNPTSPPGLLEEVQDQKYGMEDDDLGFGPS